ncbi:MAG: hypothetical protein R3E31_02585 [Chloroflexota bacterium]
MTFEKWMAAVDVAVGDIAFGLSVHDLPDIDFRSLYEDGATPEAVAREALDGADFPFDVDDLFAIDDDAGFMAFDELAGLDWLE